jgi:hypothetical protein
VHALDRARLAAGRMLPAPPWANDGAMVTLADNVIADCESSTTGKLRDHARQTIAAAGGAVVGDPGDFRP